MIKVVFQLEQYKFTNNIRTSLDSSLNSGELLGSEVGGMFGGTFFCSGGWY